MTLLAGIYARRPGDAVPDSICRKLRRSLSRNLSDEVQVLHHERCFLAKVDIGAYASPAVNVDGRGATFLVGEPLLDRPDGRSQARSVDVGQIHADLLRGSLRTLQLARGIFALAHFDFATGELILATDKLGLRPVYYSIGDRYVIFATAMRVLEHIDEVPKTMDVRGITEFYALEYSLSDRTPFAGVKLLRSGESLRVSGGKTGQSFYWRWDDIEASDRPIADLTKDVYDKFQEAVSVRNGTDTSTAAFLSGGLDSRSIVMALVQRGIHVRTFNFSIQGTQDQVFGAEFARLAGTTHTEHARPHRQQVSAMMADAWGQIVASSPHIAERSRIVWSGNGGSVALGFVYLTQRMVALARQGDLNGAIDCFRQTCASEVPTRLLRPPLREALTRVVHQGVVEELADLRCSDPGRSLYLFLMMNDQRRHCASHFEEIDVNRLEYHLPFFDAEFVASVMRVPLDVCLEHVFYMKWLRLFPKIVLDVPWQAYPGHEPCPLPIPAHLPYQWEDAEVAKVRRAQRRELLDQASAMLHARDFPSGLLRKQSLRLATIVYRLGLRDVGHLIGAAHMYYKYWTLCGGKYLPPAISSDRARVQ